MAARNVFNASDPIEGESGDLQYFFLPFDYTP